MVFAIHRASEIDALTAPCSKAKCIYEKEENGEILYREWEIEINTIEELLELEKEVGKLILYPGRITIYDDYVE